MAIASWLVVALSLAVAGCARNEATPAPLPAPPVSSAHPAPFIHPPIPPDPAPQARPECSQPALTRVAARIRETGKVAARALDPHKKKDQAAKCGSPAMTELDHAVKIDLADRVRICVGQDGPLDPEWNLLDASLGSLGVCVDCSRPAAMRAGDCKRSGELVTQAESEAAKEPAAAAH